jgi:hypothetical protein
MKNYILILAFFLSYNLSGGQCIIQISGNLKLITNPCLNEICPPGLVWSLVNDTTSFILTSYHNWIWSDHTLVINDKEYFENDRVCIYGQKSKKQEWNGTSFYELEMADQEIKDTLLNENHSLKLVFVFRVFECGIKVLKHPENQCISRLDYNQCQDTATYTYAPKHDFTGVDTVVFLTGCGSDPDNMHFKIVEFFIHVSDFTKTGNLTNDKNLYLFPNPFSSGLNYELSAVESNKKVAFEILDLSGRTISRFDKYANKGEIDFPDVPAGTYIVKITATNQVLTQLVIKQ